MRNDDNTDDADDDIVMLLQEFDISSKTAGIQENLF